MKTGAYVEVILKTVPWSEEHLTNRRDGAVGVVIGRKNSLNCYRVQHEDGSIANYLAEELKSTYDDHQGYETT